MPKYNPKSTAPEQLVAKKILEIMQSELVAAMAQTGRPTLASIDRTLVKTHFS